MKTIKNSKDITTLEVGDKVVFGDLEYKVFLEDGYHLFISGYNNDAIFNILNISKRDFVRNLGIDTLPIGWSFPEVKSLEALTAIVSALFKEYEKQTELPKTWEEFCKRNKIKEGESYIDCYEQDTIEVDIDNVGIDRDPRMDKNLCTSKQEAEAFLALMQLRQLRKAYVKNWEPDFKQTYFGILFSKHGIHIGTFWEAHRHLSFPTHYLAKQFLTNFKDLLEIAKPLL